MGWLCDWEGEPPEVLVVVGTRTFQERQVIKQIVNTRVQGGKPVLGFEKSLDAVGESLL